MRIANFLLLSFLLSLTAACGHDSLPASKSPEAWIRLGPPDAMMLAGYLSLSNDEDQPLRLQSIESDAFGAIEVHRTELVDGVSQMREVTDLSVPPHGRVVLEPGGMHLMLMQPKRPLKEGERVMIRLHWTQGESLRTDTVFFSVSREPPAQ